MKAWRRRRRRGWRRKRWQWQRRLSGVAAAWRLNRETAYAASPLTRRASHQLAKNNINSAALHGAAAYGRSEASGVKYHGVAAASIMAALQSGGIITALGVINAK